MTWPWDVLGLQPGSSAQEIRQAYARLVRQHRPDDDPAGFRRVRDAYEHALRVLAERTVDGDTAEPESDACARGEAGDPGAPARGGERGPPTSPRARPHGAGPGRPPSRPRALAAPLRLALARARSKGRHGAEARLLALLARSLRARPYEPEIPQLALAELEIEGSALRRCLQPTDVDHLADASAELMRALLLAHVTADDWPAFWAAVATIEAVTARSGGAPESAAIAVAVPIIAFLDAKRAARIADTAFTWAGAGSRDLLGGLQFWILAGSQVRTRAPAATRKQLILALCDPEIVLEDPVAQRALATVLEQPSAAVLTAALLRRFPAAEARVRAAATEHQRRRRSLHAERVAFVPGGVRRVGALVLLALVGLAAVSHCERRRVAADTPSQAQPTNGAVDGRADPELRERPRAPDRR
jgi:hypothetical protein